MTATQMSPGQIAQVCHEANRGLQRTLPTDGIPVAARWPDFEDQASVISGVELAMAGATPEELHENWVREKIAAGWVYGERKDVEAKTHPCLVAYEELPDDQRRKDRLFSAIVGALA